MLHEVRRVRLLVPSFVFVRFLYPCGSVSNRPESKNSQPQPDRGKNCISVFLNGIQNTLRPLDCVTASKYAIYMDGFCSLQCGLHALYLPTHPTCIVYNVVHIHVLIPAYYLVLYTTWYTLVYLATYEVKNRRRAIDTKSEVKYMVGGSRGNPMRSAAVREV
ncbi:hypothetical protein C8J57DRAFT_1306131, partial [Mycena rebaudengoi]